MDDDLRSTLRDAQRPVFLYGTTPPRADATPERIDRAATRLAARIKGLEIDGIVVYDVQDEAGRTAAPRPFPFLPTLDSRVYARRLAQETGRAVIAYKCVAGMPEAAWPGWLDETARTYGIPCISLVGKAASRDGTVGGGVSLTRALETARAHPAGYMPGGVVIPERHAPGRSEADRLIQKARAGCDYFISQAVYDPAATIALLRDYDATCRAEGTTPKRIVLTFTPCGHPETLRFIKWLGGRVPEDVEKAIFGSAVPLAESLKTCARHLRQILTSATGLAVPLGVNIESVSIKKDEIDASVELVGRLHSVVAAR